MEVLVWDRYFILGYLDPSGMPEAFNVKLPMVSSSCCVYLK